MLDVDKAIVFAEREGFRALELDVYRIADSADASAPLIVYVHGGGWRVGHRRAPRETREWEDGFFDRLCAAGFVVAAVSYRFSGEATYPAQLDDVLDAVRWLHAHADELGIDPARSYVWGASAGGMLAALLALVPEAPPIAGAVIWYAVSDFGAFGPTELDEAVALFGGPLDQHADAVAAASAVTHVHRDAPPFLIQHGESDTWVPFDQGVRLERALREAGADVVFEPVPGADHFFNGAPDVEAIFERAVRFLQRVDARARA